MKKLNQIEFGQTVTVAKINHSGALKRRIMDMGITRGAKVSVRYASPFGDPIVIRVRGCDLCIRRSDAGAIEVM